MFLGIRQLSSLLALALALLIVQASTAAACWMTPIGPRHISEPDKVIEEAYFIGLVKVLDRREIQEPRSFHFEVDVELVHPYKTAQDYDHELKTARDVTRDAGMCNTNGFFRPGDLREGIVMRHDDGFTITTDSLGQERWSSLRKASPLPEWLHKLEQECIETGATWYPKTMDTAQTLNFRCAPSKP